MTTSLRSLCGIVFAALLALSLVATTSQALADTRGTNGRPNLFDPGFVDNATFQRNLPRPFGRFGVTWE